jgi:hypothetical protein
MTKGLAAAVAATAIALSGAAAASAAPSNDNFMNREALSSSLPLQVSGTNVGATSEPGEPEPDVPAFAGHSIWFSWEATATEFVTVGTCGSEINTVLGAYTGSAVSALTPVASNRYSFGPNCPFFGSEVTFKAVDGTSYDLAVDGNAFRGPGDPTPVTEGSVNLEISAQSPPVNDDFEDALALEGTSALAEAENWAATKQTDEPDHRGDPGGASVWFKWTAPRAGGVFLQACGGPQETLVAAYTGDSVGNLTPVTPLESNPACDLTFGAVAGVTYKIAVDGKLNQSTDTASMGEGQLSLLMVPGNDDFEHPATLGAGPLAFYIGYRTIGATKQPGEPAHAGDPGGASVWFSWTAPATGSVRVSACDATFPALVAAYTGSSLVALVPVKSEMAPLAEPCSPSSQKAIAFNTDAGATYRIVVDGSGGATGRFDLGIDFSHDRIAEDLGSRLALDTTTPNTRLQKKILKRRGGVAVFRLRSTEAGSSFTCRLDSRPLSKCGSVVRYRALKPGRHVFQASAIDAAGNVDPKPLIVHFKIPRPRPWHRSHGRERKIFRSR